MNETDKEIIEKVRKWIANPKFTFEDIIDPSNPENIAIHVKGLTDKDYFGNQREIQYFVEFCCDNG